MKDLDGLMKELLVDWESVLSDDFNPLVLSLDILVSSSSASKFREMFHRLEFGMEEIIAENYRGFGDSVLSYNEVSRRNGEALRLLGEVEREARAIRREDLRLGELEEARELSGLAQRKYGICRGVSEAKRMMAEMGTGLLERSHTLVAVLERLGGGESVRIRAVEEFRKGVYRKYREVVAAVNERVCDFVFRNCREAEQAFGCVVVLGSLHELEFCLAQSFGRRLFSELEAAVVEFERERGHSLERLCARVAAKAESVRANMFRVMALAVRHFAIDAATGAFAVRDGARLPDFFGREDATLRFVCDPAPTYDAIKAELGNFIRRYRDSLQDDDYRFSFDSVADDLSYGSLYPAGHPILARLARSSGPRPSADTGRGYSVVTATSAEVALFLLRHSKDAEIVGFLSAEVGRIYRAQGLVLDKKRIDVAFGNAPLQVNPASGKVAIYELATQIFKDDYASYQRDLKDHFSNRLIAFLTRIYLEIFTSDLITKIANDDNQGNTNNNQGNTNINEGNTNTNQDIKNTNINTHQSDRHTIAFQTALVEKCISKKDLILNSQQYRLITTIISSLQHFDPILNHPAIRSLHSSFRRAFSQQINIEFFYFFDLFYRQGHFHHYIHKIAKLVALVHSVAQDPAYFASIYPNTIHYAIHNVGAIKARSREALVLFVENIRVLDEVLGEVEFHHSLDELYTFLNNVLDGSEESKYGKLLIRRIK